ncbi:MAG: (deoxy)nucleoside triphosphate pyrophosphohydrolase [Planctomycetota bacterium]
MTAERIEVCAAVVLRADGRVLAARRTRPPELAGRWEFPGGKLEPGETPAECLVRELQEELGIDVLVGGALGASERPPGDGLPLRLTAYEARPAGAGCDPLPVDGTHDAVRWVDAASLETLEWAPLDVPLLEGARLYLERGPRSPGG